MRLEQAELAEAAGVSLETVRRIESMEGELKIRLDTLTKIKTALERAGIEFIAENGGGAGVRVRKAKMLARLGTALPVYVTQPCSVSVRRSRPQ